uniref:RRM domain-containing protein n=1 Tax=Anopheles triannulatus TaxID=58253 RepID=A0A2M4ANK4_9DIPT
MGDFMDLSLDDIIKKGKKDRKPKSGIAGGISKTVVPPRKNAGVRRFSTAAASENSGTEWMNRKPKPVGDARWKIIEKNRSKIVDARDKLIELTRAGGDARLRLLRKGLVRGGEAAVGSGSGSAPPPLPRTTGNGVHKDIGRGSSRHHHNTHPHQKSAAQEKLMSRYGLPMAELDPMEIDDVGLAHGGNRRVVPTSALKRTVLNESFNMPISMPPLPSFRTIRQPSPPPATSGWMSDPFECYEPIRRPTLKAAQLPLPPQQSVHSLTHAHPPYEPSAVRPRSSLRTTTTTRAHASPLAGAGGLPFEFQPPEMLSSTMRARLERAPNPNESMGIFAKMPPDEPIQQYKPATYTAGSSYQMHSPASASPPRASAATTGYRIIVSNLHSNVTQQDIQELFEDIGDLLESRLVRTGVAEVIYRTLRDAENAVDAYHNRQLDGQPMNCLLVHPRSSGKPTASAIKYGR